MVFISKSILSDKSITTPAFFWSLFVWNIFYLSPLLLIFICLLIIILPKGFFCDWTHEIKRCLLLGKKAMRNLDSILKSRDITLPVKVHMVKFMIFPVVMYRCESWTIKKAEHQRTDAESEAPILWPLDEKSQLIGKDPDAGKDWRQEEKGKTEDEMVG